MTEPDGTETTGVRAVGPAVVLGAGVTPGAAVAFSGTEAGGQASVVSGQPLITELSSAPIGEPVALRREADGLFRPDRGAIADRPTRTEVTTQIDTTLTAHVLDPTPHPPYDDIPDLTLWYRNALL